MRIALYQPDIALNVGTIIRLGACMGVPVDIIEPCGFPFGDAALRRSGLDYLPKAEITRHRSWDEFLRQSHPRLILASTKANNAYTDFDFAGSDTLLLGSESAGVPESVALQCHHRVRIPMKEGTRSLNIAVAAGMILGEMLRQNRASQGVSLNEY